MTSRTEAEGSHGGRRAASPDEGRSCDGTRDRGNTHQGVGAEALAAWGGSPSGPGEPAQDARSAAPVPAAPRPAAEIPRGSLPSLLRRVFAANAAVLVIAAALLVLSPATVSAPVALEEAIVLVGGMSAMLVVNLFLLRRAFAPLERLRALMREVDLLRPGQRVAVGAADREVAELERAFNAMLSRLEGERRESVRAALAAQEGERKRIAHELHDEVGQALTAVLLQLSVAAKQVPQERLDAIRDAQETTRYGLEEVRRIAGELRPEALDDLGLVDALTAMSDRVVSRSDVRLERRLEDDLPKQAPEAELVIYRVAQEALTNVVRHARAARVSLGLVRRGEGVRLEVTDDGCGVSDAEPQGAGIRGMRERAVLVGAHLVIRSQPGVGTAVTLDLDPPA
jgi:two-component system, NarL family, sensor histidine kinase UhpB